MDMEQEVQRFRMELLRKYPFYGDIVMRLPFVANPQIETARTNGYQIEYSPRFFEKLYQPQRRYVLMHEVLHVMLFHCSRRGDRDPELWNVAADLLVNSMLDRMKTSLSGAQIQIERPPDGIFGYVNDLDTVENVYQQLKNLNQGRRSGSPVKYKARGRGYYSEDAQTRPRRDLIIGKEAGEGGEAIAGMTADGLTDGYGVDVVLECSGSQAGIAQGLEMVRKCGWMTLIALAGKPITFDIEKVNYKELHFSGSIASTYNNWEKCLALLRLGYVDLKPMATGFYKFDDWQQAFQDMVDKKGLKLLFKMEDD